MGSQIRKPLPPERLSDQTVAVVGSGPAGLACAQQLTRAGHTVVVFERDDEVGGLMRYGIPNFKLEKGLLDRRVKQMEAEGTRFRTNTEIGNHLGWDDLRSQFDAVVVAIGSTVPRDMSIPGRDLDGIHFAMEFLPDATRRVFGKQPIHNNMAKDKHVVIIGGGDTGSDCLGTSIRQGAKDVTVLQIMPQEPTKRPDNQPWPTFARLYQKTSSMEEGGEYVYSTDSVNFVGSEEDAAKITVSDNTQTEGLHLRWKRSCHRPQGRVGGPRQGWPVHPPAGHRTCDPRRLGAHLGRLPAPRYRNPAGAVAGRPRWSWQRRP